MSEDWSVWQSHAAWSEAAAAAHRRDSEAMAVARDAGTLRGQCDLCERSSQFGRVPQATSLREGLPCEHCRGNARQRAAASVLLDALPRLEQARVYLTEQASAFHVALRRRSPHLIGSEFTQPFLRRLRLSSWLWRHGVAQWIRREDVTALTFPTSSLDAAVSLDVLEHVPDYRAALREFARVLKPGGVLVLTVPFYEDRAGSAQIARLAGDGRVEHLGAPEFHGDPLGGGVPCFHHFGWDLLEAMREAGFAEVDAIRVQSLRRGLPQGIWVLRARR